MTSLIEQAAERLAQIRAAGIAAPDIASVPPGRGRVEATIRVLSEPSSKAVDLDLLALAAAGYLVPSAPSSHMADQYRVLKRPLIANAIGNQRSLEESGRAHV